MSTHQHHASDLSPVMQAYARLVAVYREWNACDMTQPYEVSRLLRRIDGAKGRLANLCAGKNYLALWQSAVAESKLPTEEAHDGNH